MKYGKESCVNIIITSFNRIESTARCIRSVREHTKIPYTLTVVDDGSNDGSLDFLLLLYKKKEIDRLFVHQNNMGVAVALNTGMSDHQCQYTVKLDNDMVIHGDDWLDNLIEVAEKYSDIGVVAYDVYKNERVGECDFCGGSAMLITSEALEKLGCFCEEYGLYGEEDSDFGARIRFAGLKNFYIPLNGQVEHDEWQRSYGSSEFDDRRTRKNRSEAICCHFFNLFMYSQGLRPIKLARRYTAVSKPGMLIDYVEEEHYKHFLADLETLKTHFIKQNKEALEDYIGVPLNI